MTAWRQRLSPPRDLPLFGKCKVGNERFQQETKEAHSHAMAREVPVPAMSILNIVLFDIVGSPEVSVLREDTKLMRWTCMLQGNADSTTLAGG
jgi:hypothetical protein